MREHERDGDGRLTGRHHHDEAGGLDRVDDITGERPEEHQWRQAANEKKRDAAHRPRMVVNAEQQRHEGEFVTGDGNSISDRK